jgi:hypothetical protein
MTSRIDLLRVLIWGTLIAAVIAFWPVVAILIWWGFQ